MKFTAQFKVPSLDMTATRQLIHQTMMELLAQAALQWVTAAEGEVPVWTGASKATFLQLAHAAGFDIAITPAPTAPNDGTGLGQAQSEGKLEPVNPNDGKYFFTYKTRLEHLIENEYTDATLRGLRLKKPGPYNFQEFGRIAFEQFARDAQLPEPVIKVTRLNA